MELNNFTADTVGAGEAGLIVLRCWRGAGGGGAALDADTVAAEVVDIIPALALASGEDDKHAALRRSLCRHGRGGRRRHSGTRGCVLRRPDR